MAVGTMAGSGITFVDNNIIIGHHSGVHSRFGQEDNVCYIGNIYGANVDNFGGVARVVCVDPDGRLGTMPIVTPTPTPRSGNPGKSSPKRRPASGNSRHRQAIDCSISKFRAWRR